MNRRLYRSRTDTILGGVAAGLANYLNADPALVRIAWAILVPLTGGAAFLAYIVAWIVVPEEPMPAPGAGLTTEAEVQRFDTETGEPLPVASIETADTPAAVQPTTRTVGGDGRAGLVVGAILVVLGIWFLLREYLPDFNWSLVWPLVLIGIGALLLVSTTRRRQ